MKKTVSGFTIVELLIVIVVIAILAAISIVAFNGIQQRSRNTQTISAAKDYIKAVSMYAADNGSYPAYTGACLGTGYDYQGTSGQCGSVAGLRENTGFNTALEKYIANKPQPSTKNLTISAGNIRAGGYYDVLSGGSSARIYYLLEGQTAQCSAGGGPTISAGAPDMYCTYIFPQL